MGYSTQERAALYAAYKYLESILDKDGFVPPGVDIPVGGLTVTVELPAETKISRDPGPDGDGTILKRATQNLYGYSVWAAFLRRLAKFQQANVVRIMLMEAWREAIASGTKVEAELREIDPEIAGFIEELKAQPGPMRVEMTPRKVHKPKAQAVVLVQSQYANRKTG